MRRGRPTPCGDTCAPRFPIARASSFSTARAFPSRGRTRWASRGSTAARWGRSPTVKRRSPAIALHAGARRVRHRGPRLGRGPACTRVACGVVAQRHAPGLAGPVLCHARHARARLARPPARARGLDSLRTRPRRERSDQVLSRPPAGNRVAAHLGATHEPALGDRAAVSGAEGRTRPRSFRGTLPSQVAAPRRPHGPGVLLAPVRTPTTGHPPAHAPPRARRHHGDPHRTFFRDATALLTNHAETRGNQSSNLAKSYYGQP